MYSDQHSTADPSSANVMDIHLANSTEDSNLIALPQASDGTRSTDAKSSSLLLIASKSESNTNAEAERMAMIGDKKNAADFVDEAEMASATSVDAVVVEDRNLEQVDLWI